MERTPIVGGNWKMHTTRAEALALAEAVMRGIGDQAPHLPEVAVYPPFLHLGDLTELALHAPLRIGAQDVFYESNGPFTGEISPDMLRDYHVTHVLVGHSERRHVIEESETVINRKLAAVLDAGLFATLCLGETEAEREAGQTETVLRRQLRNGLASISSASMTRMSIAYEPVWAIGTGRTATPEDAQAMHALLRRELATMYDEPTSDRMRIQYGGSVKPDNAASLFTQPDIDGFLVGGASLKAPEFLAIVDAVRTAAAV